MSCTVGFTSAREQVWASFLKESVLGFGQRAGVHAERLVGHACAGQGVEEQDGPNTSHGQRIDGLTDQESGLN